MYDSGNNSLAYSGSFFNAIKKGETIITVKLDNVGDPSAPAIFEHHIVVRREYSEQRSSAGSGSGPLHGVASRGASYGVPNEPRTVAG
jgi:hypothetical protein